ncbi:hypothetical protein [Streptomyces atriruber]|uniref:hypothetical protein n=1 Tax=Streptomyces atriruber TaxID=545121 RepID=UPI0006E37CEC|nr:hypothetical protein [Streptomyces atriruber]
MRPFPPLPTAASRDTRPLDAWPGIRGLPPRWASVLALTAACSLSGLATAPPALAAVNPCDSGHLVAYLAGTGEGSTGTSGGGTIVSLELGEDLRQDYVLLRNQDRNGGALGVNPASSTLWFTTQGNRVWSSKAEGTPYNWRDLSGPSYKGDIAFGKDRKGYFLAEENGATNVYVFPADRPADRRRINLNAAPGQDHDLDDPTGLAFDGRNQAWIITRHGELWTVRDTAATTWKAQYTSAAQPSTRKFEDLAFGRQNGQDALFVSGSDRGERFVARAGDRGNELDLQPTHHIAGDGSVTGLASCAFPDTWS